MSCYDDDDDDMTMMIIIIISIVLIIIDIYPVSHHYHHHRHYCPIVFHCKTLAVPPEASTLPRSPVCREPFASVGPGKGKYKNIVYEVTFMSLFSGNIPHYLKNSQEKTCLHACSHQGWSGVQHYKKQRWTKMYFWRACFPHLVHPLVLSPNWWTWKPWRPSVKPVSSPVTFTGPLGIRTYFNQKPTIKNIKNISFLAIFHQLPPTNNWG